LDLLAERIDHERQLRVASEERLLHEKELREQVETAVEKARSIQFNEYERRLEALNGEAGRIREVLEKTVPREVFEQYIKSQADASQAALQVATERRDASDRELGIKFDNQGQMIRALSERLQTWQGSLNVWRFLAGGGGVLGLVSIALWLLHPVPGQ